MADQGYAEGVRIEKTGDALAHSKGIAKSSDIREEYTMKHSTDQNATERFDSIDYRYYATKSRTLRSDAVLSFFRVMMTRFKM